MWKGHSLFYSISQISPKMILCIRVIVAGGPGNRMSPRAVIRGDVLTFTAMDPADEGEYTCKALNTHGEHTARVSIFIQSMLCFTECEFVLDFERYESFFTYQNTV